MARELPKVYDPNQVEDRIYKMWEEGKFFKPSGNKDAKPFTIVMPPPNVTGQLHMGHAMDATLQDTLIRFKRMQGYDTLWVPGVDHAGIATQIKVEEELRVKEGLSRYDLGREKFLERVWDWKHKYGNRIVEQQKKLGASCDWDRAAFTMDETCSKAVREVFVSLYEKGLIYKGSRIINWCPNCVTALSDAEVEYVDKPGHLWHIRYPLVDGTGEVVVATTRPETMLGDTGVCVNPNDERYQHIIGKKVLLPLMNKEIPVVADDYAEMEFGTGCVKMTPAHDPNDFEVGLRHNLEVIRVLNDNGVVNELGGKYEGMDRYDARKAIVADLEEQGYLVKIEEHAHNVGTCYRCHKDVEPIISAQWFVKMKTLADEAIRSVNDGETKFVPERFTKNYMNWMNNIRDWCISRQLWWGHQIPVWYCADCGHMTCSREDAHVCEKCGSANIERDPDVLDTWFSSALWPFETLGWPDEDAADPGPVAVVGVVIRFEEGAVADDFPIQQRGEGSLPVGEVILTEHACDVRPGQPGAVLGVVGQLEPEGRIKGDALNIDVWIHGVLLCLLFPLHMHVHLLVGHDDAVLVEGQLDGAGDLLNVEVDDASVTLEYGVHSVPPCMKYVCVGGDFWHKNTVTVVLS